MAWLDKFTLTEGDIYYAAMLEMRKKQSESNDTWVTQILYKRYFDVGYIYDAPDDASYLPDETFYHDDLNDSCYIEE